MSLLLLALLACATDDDTAGFDSALPDVTTLEMSARVASPMPLPSAAVATPTAAPLPTTPVAVTTPAPAPVAASCPIPAFAPPELAPEARLAAWVVQQGGMIGGGRHQLAAGETAWGIATQLDVPVWVLRAMNPAQNLDHLMVGDWVDFPVTQKNEKSAWQLYTEEECGC